MNSNEDVRKEDLRPGDAPTGDDTSPKLKEAVEQGESWMSDAPGGGTHEEETGDPVWESDPTGQQGKQSESGGAPA